MDFVAMAAICAPNAPIESISGIVKTDSTFNRLAIHINSENQLLRQPANDREAIVTATWLIDHGFNIDLGLAQINSKNLNAVGLSVAEAFDACKNLAAGERILLDGFWRAKQGGRDDSASMLAAYSAYNTGSLINGFKNGYVQKVVSNTGAVSDQVFPIPLQKSVPLAGLNTGAVGASVSRVVTVKPTEPQNSFTRALAGAGERRSSRIVSGSTKLSRMFVRTEVAVVGGAEKAGAGEIVK